LLPVPAVLVVVLLRRGTRSWLVAAGVGLAVAAQPVLTPSISPLDAALLLVAAGMALALVVPGALRSPAIIAVVAAGLVATAAIAPRLLLVAGVMSSSCGFAALDGAAWLSAI